MYFWDIRTLATELREGTLSEQERMKYWLLLTAGMTALMELTGYSATQAHPLNIMTSIVGVVGTAVGVYWTYLINRAGDNLDFVGRSLCLGLPLMVRLIALFIPISLVLLIIFGGKRGMEPIANFVLTVTLMVIYYWRLGYHLHWISRRGEAGQAPANRAASELNARK